MSDYAEYTVEAPASLPGCTYAVSPSSLNVGPSPYSSLFVNVTSNCSWIPIFPAAPNNWISFAGYTSPFATGNGQFSFFVYTNTGSARSASITVGNQTITINQSATTCTYALSQAYQNFTNAGGTGSFDVITQTGCAWSIQSSASWLTLTGSSSGTGSATIGFSAAPNANPSIDQTASLNVAGMASLIISEEPSVLQLSPSLNFIPLTPCRVLDTRSSSQGPVVAANTVRSINMMASQCQIPSTASAYSVNVTVVPHGELGYLTIFPTGQTQPVVSTLNSDGRVKANAAIVPAGTNGAISVFVTNDTDVVLDINGFFESSDYQSGLNFFPVTPCRIADTRNPAGLLGGPCLLSGTVARFPDPPSHLQSDQFAPSLLFELHGASQR